MPLTVAAIQSNYLPWKGYFDIIHDADLFIFYDDVQYTKNDWRNRNRIKVPSGTAWLTVPAGDSIARLICEVELKDPRWQATHWRTLLQDDSKAPYLDSCRAFLDEVYVERRWTSLSELNRYLTVRIAREFLGIRTSFGDSREYAPAGKGLDRLLAVLAHAGATRYVTGPSAHAYIDASRFDGAGIELVYKSYADYPEYPQFHPPFDHRVTILDLLFHTGPRASFHVWGWRGTRPALPDRAAGHLESPQPGVQR